MLRADLGVDLFSQYLRPLNIVRIIDTNRLQMERVILRLNRLLLALLPFLNQLPSLDYQLLLSVHEHHLREDLDIKDVVVVHIKLLIID